MKRTPFVLIILDGWGIASASKGNAITLADTPVMDKLWQSYPHTLLDATGTAVGLINRETSGSETGHSNIGAGRVVIQDSTYISESIGNGNFFNNPPLRRAINFAKLNSSRLHLMGLLSGNDSPHSKQEHLYALLTMAKRFGLENVYLHLFTDGRDTPPRSALGLLENLEKIIKTLNIGQITTIIGRYWAMDRVKNWERLNSAYRALVYGEGVKVNSPREAIKAAYERGLTDEFIPPTVICNQRGDTKKPKGLIGDNDAVIFFNFRSDRSRQLTKFFVSEKINGFKDRMSMLKNLFFVTMTDFGPDLAVQTAFPSRSIEMTLPFVLKNFRQLYIAETEKYAHITYFFNGGYAHAVAGENRIMIDSPQVSSYDQTPRMAAEQITKVVVSNIEKNIYDFIAINFANPDMLGHTGNIGAAIQGIEFVDECVGKIFNAVNKKNGTLFIAADHGNADEMLDLETGEVLTMHSKNPVPFIIVQNNTSKKNRVIKNLRSSGVLGDIVPTILDVMKITKPQEITGESLIIQ